MSDNLFPVAKPQDYKFCEYKLVGGDVVELKRIVAYSFEVDGTDSFRNTEAAARIHSWMDTDQGKWIMENAFETPYFDHYKRADKWSIEYKIVATLTAKKLTEYYLRFS